MSPPSTATLSVDPALLASAARRLLDAGAALQGAAPALRSAWSAAAQTLAAQRTGQALEACQAGALAALGGCAESLDRLGTALQHAAAAYRAADAQSLVTRPTVR